MCLLSLLRVPIYLSSPRVKMIFLPLLYTVLFMSLIIYYNIFGMAFSHCSSNGNMLIITCVMRLYNEREWDPSESEHSNFWMNQFEI